MLHLLLAISRADQAGFTHFAAALRVELAKLTPSPPVALWDGENSPDMEKFDYKMTPEEIERFKIEAGLL